MTDEKFFLSPLFSDVFQGRGGMCKMNEKSFFLIDLYVQKCYY